MRARSLILAVLTLTIGSQVGAPIEVGTVAAPYRASEALVISANALASNVGWRVLRDGGNAIDAAVATAFALAVTHPTAGNIGGGGFLVYRPSEGAPTTFDFRERAPAAASPEMWLKDGQYDPDLHHNSHRSVGVPGTVAGLHLAWKSRGSRPWRSLVEPAVQLARNGFEVTDNLARGLERMIPEFTKHPASLAQFTKAGVPYRAGELLKQPDLARSLERIARHGPAGFYEGETADLLVEEMRAHGGLITHADLRGYDAKERPPVVGSYRGYEVIGMAPPSSGGLAVQLMLNILEGFDLKSKGYGSAEGTHLVVESMRRAFAERARSLGDPDFVTNPVAQLLSKDYAADLRKTIDPAHASTSQPSSFTWTPESPETTHFSIVDKERNAVSLTYTLEYGYGSRIVVPGAGFLLNNEMGDFNAGPGLTTENGLVGTPPNLALPNKRMLSSMAPTIVARDGKLAMVTGSPGGRTIINTVLLTLLNVLEFGMNAQTAVDAGRLHHQWLPDRITYERYGWSPDTIEKLRAMGHTLTETEYQGVAEVIVMNGDTLEGGIDRRVPDGGAAGR